MGSQQPRSLYTTVVRRRQRRAAAHTRRLVRTVPPHPAPSATLPAVRLSTAALGQGTAEAYLSRLGPSVPRQRTTWGTARAKIRTLQHRVAQRERELDQALTDSADLRLRLTRLATRFYTLEAACRPAVAAPQTKDLESLLQRQLDCLNSAEQRNSVLGQELVRLRGAMDALLHSAATPSVAPKSSSAPWYRRFWFGLIGKDVRAAEWTASQRAP